MAAIPVPFGLPTQQAIAQIVGGSITLVNASGSNAAGTATAGSAVVTNVAGYNAVSFQITGTFVGTLQPQFSTDNGTSWWNASYTNLTGTVATAAFTAVTSAPQWMVDPGAVTQYRMLATAWTSGTAVVTFTNGIGGNPIGEAAGGGGTNATIIAPLGNQTAAASVAVTIEGVNGTDTSTGNLPVNTAAVNGVTILTGTGATGTGSQRMTVAIDAATVAGSASLPSGSNLVGKVGIDQTTPGTTNATSIAQIGATTVSSGAGAVGTGTQRIAVGQDTTTVAGTGPTVAAFNQQATVSVTTTATQVLASFATRKDWNMSNNGATDAYWGNSAVVSGAGAAANGGGIVKAGGGSVSGSPLGILTAALFMITAAGTTVGYGGDW